jgi:hypothetical protein
MEEEIVSKCCSKCDKTKSIEEFRRREKGKEARRSECRDCYNKDSRKRNERNVRLLREYLRNKGCKCCGNTNPLHLQFHHVRGEKKAKITDMVKGRRSWESILEEMEKCDVVCANCHQAITIEERNTYLWQILQEEKENDEEESYDISDYS